MASFLAIETATNVCSVAVLTDGHIVIEMALSRPRAHSENLVPMMRDALNYAGLSVKDLAGVVVSKGPGSYTGLRIGVSAAKGLAYSHDINLIGVPSLLSIATATLPLAGAGDVIAAAFNSRKNEVYLGLFAVNKEENMEGVSLNPISEVTSRKKDEIATYLQKEAPLLKSGQKLILAGEGAALVSESLRSEEAYEIDLIPPHLVSPSASTIAILGAARYKNGQIDDSASFEPFYLNEFIAKTRKKSIFERLPF